MEGKNYLYTKFQTFKGNFKYICIVQCLTTILRILGSELFRQE